MTKILTIDGKNIKPLEKTRFDLESDLQDYLENYPQIIPLDEIIENASELTCIGREVIVPSGAIDLMFIDREGLITIVETKLVKNPEIRRTVIGQLIEYASFVSQWKSGDIDEVAYSYLAQKQGGERASLFVGKFTDDIKHSIEDNLQNGKMRLIIAVDELNEPLRATVTFLNSHSNFDILLLQVSSFEESEFKKVITSSLFGYAQKISGTQRSSKINEEIFLARCREGKHEKAVELYLKAKALKDSRKEFGDFMNWGVSGYSYRMPWRGYRNGETIFTAYSDGKLMIWPDLLVRAGEIGQKYMGKLRNMAVLTNEFSRNKYPTISTDKMKASDIDTFILVIKELGNSLDEVSKEQT